MNFIVSTASRYLLAADDTCWLPPALHALLPAECIRWPRHRNLAAACCCYSARSAAVRQDARFAVCHFLCLVGALAVCCTSHIGMYG